MGSRSRSTGGRTGDERGGRERARGQSRAGTGLLEQTARARVDEWERNGMGMGMDGPGWDDCLWGEGGAKADVQCSPSQEQSCKNQSQGQSQSQSQPEPASETAENGGALKWR